MITLQKEEKLIDKLCSLTELEIQPILKELREHLYKNKMGHLMEDNLQRVEELEDEVEDLKEEIQGLESTLDEIKMLCP